MLRLRFGKTLSSYDFAKKFNAKNVLIVTNRPAIEFLNKANSSSEDKQITFLRLQDLKGGRALGGPHNKLKWVADLNWDLLIIDESGKMIELDAEKVLTYYHRGGC